MNESELDRLERRLANPPSGMDTSEAVGDWQLVPKTLTPAMLKAGARGRQNGAAASFADGWKFALDAAPQSAPEAGKLPSEEAVARVIAKAMGYPADKFWEIYAPQARAALALLSPAQPHDVPAGDGDVKRYLVRKGEFFYRPNASGYTLNPHAAGRYSKHEAEAHASVEPWHMEAVEEPSHAEMLVWLSKECPAAADALEAQGRRIAAERRTALDEAIEIALECDKQDEIDNGAAATGAAGRVAEFLAACATRSTNGRA